MTPTATGGQPAGEPFDPSAWITAGFTEQEARGWHRWRIAPQTAVAWRQAGVPEALRAAQWSIARVTPDTVGQWHVAGLDASEAVHCHELGFDLAAARDLKRRGLTPEQAFAQGRAGTVVAGSGMRVAVPMGDPIFTRLQELKIPPQVLHTYVLAQWLEEAAVGWARAQVPADVARQWHELGLYPVEGVRLIRAGRTFAEVIREWWRAGIPYDEVADWLGAGLTAQEAVAQRERGITAEHAAALRALRRGDDGAPAG